MDHLPRNSHAAANLPINVDFTHAATVLVLQIWKRIVAFLSHTPSALPLPIWPQPSTSVMARCAAASECGTPQLQLCNFVLMQLYWRWWFVNGPLWNTMSAAAAAAPACQIRCSYRLKHCHVRWRLECVAALAVWFLKVCKMVVGVADAPVGSYTCCGCRRC